MNNVIEIEIRQNETTKTLYMNGVAQSALDLTNPKNPVFAYMQYIFLPFLLADVKRALFIGGGAFSGPRIFSQMGVTVDTVEINPDLVAIAKIQFGIDTEKVNIIIDDGRKFLEKNAQKYDLIFVDAFIGEKTPLHLQTLSFFQLVAKRLNPHGVFLSNNITAPQSSHFLSLHKTISSVFSSVYVFDVDSSSLQTRNVMFMAQHAKKISNDELIRKSQASLIDSVAELKTEIDVVDSKDAQFFLD